MGSPFIGPSNRIAVKNCFGPSSVSKSLQFVFFRVQVRRPVRLPRGGRIDICDYVIVMADPRELSKRLSFAGEEAWRRARSPVLIPDSACLKTTTSPNVRDSARQLLAKLKEHDADFRKTHLTLVELIDDEELSTEQATLDEHDHVASLTVRIMNLVDATNPTSSREVSTHELLVRRCERLESRLTETKTALTREDVCKLLQYQEQLLDFKK